MGGGVAESFINQLIIFELGAEISDLSVFIRL